MIQQGTSSRRRKIVRRRKGPAVLEPQPALHQATYQFSDEAALDRAMNGADLKRLVADFDRDWPGITRTRELLVLAEEYGVG